MNNLPKNWKLSETYDGNFIFENEPEEFSVTVDQMGRMSPPYSINFQQLKGTFTKIGFEHGAYSTQAFSETEALPKALEMIEIINQKSQSSLYH
jgi:hypothetical protein